jgi:NADPH-dependent curcumin reductase CurA
VQIKQLSLDLAMQGWMNAGKSYVRPVEIGEVMRAYGTGVGTASRHPNFPVGAIRRAHRRRARIRPLT